MKQTQFATLNLIFQHQNKHFNIRGTHLLNLITFNRKKSLNLGADPNAKFKKVTNKMNVGGKKMSQQTNDRQCITPNKFTRNTAVNKVSTDKEHKEEMLYKLWHNAIQAKTENFLKKLPNKTTGNQTCKSQTSNYNNTLTVFKGDTAKNSKKKTEPIVRAQNLSKANIKLDRADNARSNKRSNVAVAPASTRTQRKNEAKDATVKQLMEKMNINSLISKLTKNIHKI